MKVLNVFVIVLMFILISCTDNSSKPELKQVKLTKLYTIDGYPEDADPERCFEASYSVKIDKNGYLYIYDQKSGSIKVFDKSGNFFSSISKKGIGPEELEHFDTFFLKKDTVCVFDNRIKLKKFFNTGEFISMKIINPELFFMPLNFSLLTDSTLLGRVNNYKKTEDSAEISCDLTIFDNNFNKVITLADPKVKFPDDGYTLEYVNPVYAYNSENIFVAAMSKSEYSVKVYSHSGEYLRTIRQNYAKTKYSKHEMELILSEFPRESDHFDYYFDFKLAISDLAADKNGYLWVQRNPGLYGSDIYYDIFKDDGIIAKFVLKNDGTNEFERAVYLSEYLYIFDYFNNSIDVYDYEIENLKEEL